MGRGFAWLVGHSCIVIKLAICAILEQRQGVRIACPEKLPYAITSPTQFYELAQEWRSYGEYPLAVYRSFAK
jgi:hypothetical protein